MTDISKIVLEKTNRDSYRLVVIEKDMKTGARSVKDIYESFNAMKTLTMCDPGMFQIPLEVHIRPEAIPALFQFSPGRTERVLLRCIAEARDEKPYQNWRLALQALVQEKTE